MLATEPRGLAGELPDESQQGVTIYRRGGKPTVRVPCHTLVWLALLVMVPELLGCRSAPQTSPPFPSAKAFPPLSHYGSKTVLTRELVAKWTATRDDDCLESLLEELGDPADAKTVAEAQAAMDRAAAHARLNRIVRAYGFASAEEYVQVRARVLAASPEAMVFLTRSERGITDQQALHEALTATTAEMRVMRELVGRVSEKEIELVREALKE
ncbi:MAG: hypothetical protein ACUVX8_07685 [Candidatus Zipacnadales bacterium]